jgi:hypothetical protein
MVHSPFLKFCDSCMNSVIEVQRFRSRVSSSASDIASSTAILPHLAPFGERSEPRCNNGDILVAGRQATLDCNLRTPEHVDGLANAGAMHRTARVGRVKSHIASRFRGGRNPNREATRNSASPKSASALPLRVHTASPNLATMCRHLPPRQPTKIRWGH